MPKFPKKFNGPEVELDGRIFNFKSLQPGMARRFVTDERAYVVANNRGVYEVYREEPKF